MLRIYCLWISGSFYFTLLSFSYLLMCRIRRILPAQTGGSGFITIALQLVTLLIWFKGTGWHLLPLTPVIFSLLFFLPETRQFWPSPLSLLLESCLSCSVSANELFSSLPLPYPSWFISFSLHATLGHTKFNFLQIYFLFLTLGRTGHSGLSQHSISFLDVKSAISHHVT